MTDTQKSRRSFLKNLAAGSAVVGASTMLSACSSDITSPNSYMTRFVANHKNSPVYFWTDVMLQAIRNKGIAPPPATRAFAMAHVAGFLAVNGIEQTYENNVLPMAQPPQGADPAIAYGVAFSYALSDALQALFTFDRMRFLDQFDGSQAKSDSIKWGKYVAKQVIKSRTGDGAESFRSNAYLGRYARREDVLKWTPTGPFYDAGVGPIFETFSRGLAPGWGKQKPWIMRSTNDFLVPSFIDVESPEFAQQLTEVRELGGTDSTLRTKDQTDIAFYWEDGPGSLSPPGHWQLMAMNITQDMNLSLSDLACMFTQLSLSQADAAIAVWHSKYSHDIVRPETIIRNRAMKITNPDVQRQLDPNWKTLVFTPGFPAYVSGHSAFSAASARILANIIGRDDITFSGAPPDLVVWPERLRGLKRSWNSLWQAAEENGMSRIYGGVHWQVDNVEGLALGKKIADNVHAQTFKKRV